MAAARTRRQVLHLIGGAAALATGFGLGLWRKWLAAPSEPTTPEARGPATSLSPATATTADIPPVTSSVVATAPSTTTSSSTSTTTTTVAPTTTQPAPTALEVIERAAWGAGPAQGTLLAHSVERITIHHSGGLFEDNREGPERVLGYQRFHQGRDFVDLAYHFAIDLDGNIYEGRDYAIPGETFTSYDPTGHFLPMCIGNFEEQRIGEAQFTALVDIVAWAVTHFGVSVDTISGHRDHAATACPGQDLYARLTDGSLAARVTDRLAAGGVELHYLRGEAATTRVAAITAGNA